MSNPKNTPKPNTGLWYDQPPEALASNARFHISRMEAHIYTLKNKINNLEGDGWVRGPMQIKAPTERDELNSALLDEERRMIRLQNMADAFTRIGLRGGKSSEIDAEILTMKNSGLLKRHPMDLHIEKVLEDEMGITPNDQWFTDYNPKYSV